jgi:phosphoglycerate dehydrogenase-like enzyme
MPTILLSAPYMIPFLERFQPYFDQYKLETIVPEVNERLDKEHLLELAGSFDGTICGDDQYDSEVIEACAPRLKVISKWGTGIDSIDKDSAQKLGIKVFRTTNAFTVPVADTVLGYILAFARRQPWMDKGIKSGIWNKLPGHALSESTLGVIGVGNIGKAVLSRAKGFGMQLVGNDIVTIDPDFIRKTGVEMTSLDDLLSKADYISVNCDLNPTSYHIINAETLSQMKSCAVVINTARGHVIDEPALVHALQTGLISGAALDVFEIEPIPSESPLLSMENVMLAPHNANSSPAAWEKVHWNTLRNLLDGLEISFGGDEIENMPMGMSR